MALLQKKRGPALTEVADRGKEAYEKAEKWLSGNRKEVFLMAGLAVVTSFLAYKITKGRRFIIVL
jgi:hypothetical protein